VIILIDGRDRSSDVLIEGGLCKISRQASDPIAKTTMTIYDKDNPSKLAEMQEVIILDDPLSDQPAHNLLNDPDFSSGGAHYAQITNSGLSIVIAAGVTMSFSNTANGNTGSLSQNTQTGLVVVGQTYYYSMQVNVTSPLSGGNAFLSLQFLDAGGNNLGSPTTATYTSGNARRSINAVAPAGAVYVQASFGIKATSNTNSGTVVFSNQQLEPAFFAQLSYPSPVITSDPAAYTLPNGTVVKQSRIFAGFITGLKADEYLAGERHVDVEVASLSHMLEVQGVSVSYQSSTQDLTIIDNMLSASFNGYIKRYNNAVAGVMMPPQYAREGSGRDVMDDCCANSGYVWYVDPYYELHYKWLGYRTSWPNLSDNPDFSSTVPFYNYLNETDGTQIANQIVVTGGNFGQGTPPENFTGNGTTTKFTLSQQPFSIKSITVNGVAQRLGISGVSASGSYDVSWSNSSMDINFVTAPAAAAAIVVTYDIAATAKVRATDLQSVAHYKTANFAGVFTRYITDNTLVTLQAAAQRAVIELIQYSYGLKIVTLSTQWKFNPTAMVNLTKSDSGYDRQPFLVQKSDVVYKGVDETKSDVWEYNLTLGAYYRYLSNIMNHIQRGFQQNSSQPIAPILEEHAVVIEQLTYRDDGLTGTLV